MEPKWPGDWAVVYDVESRYSGVTPHCAAQFPTREQARKCARQLAALGTDCRVEHWTQSQGKGKNNRGSETVVAHFRARNLVDRRLKKLDLAFDVIELLCKGRLKESPFTVAGLTENSVVYNVQMDESLEDVAVVYFYDPSFPVVPEGQPIPFLPDVPADVVPVAEG